MIICPLFAGFSGVIFIYCSWNLVGSWTTEYQIWVDQLTSRAGHMTATNCLLIVDDSAFQGDLII